MTSILYINTKWKKTELYEALSKLQFRILYDEEMKLLDLRSNANGFVYIQASKNSPEMITEYRKLLVKIHNTHTDLVIQTLVDYTDRSFFNTIQQFATIELKIQVIPIEGVVELAQYLERQMLSEANENKNPFMKDLNLIKPNEVLFNCIRNIPKIGDKNAKTLATVFQNLKNLSNATYEELKDLIGPNCSKAVVDFFTTSKLTK